MNPNLFANHALLPNLSCLRHPAPAIRFCKQCKKRAGLTANCPTCDKYRTTHKAESLTIRIGQRLKHLREQSELSQKQMSEDFGIDRSFISDVERGRKAVSAEMLGVFAAGFEMTISEFMEGL